MAKGINAYMFNGQTWKITVDNYMIQVLKLWPPEVLKQGSLGAKTMQQNIVTITAMNESKHNILLDIKKCGLCSQDMNA